VYHCNLEVRCIMVLMVHTMIGIYNLTLSLCKSGIGTLLGAALIKKYSSYCTKQKKVPRVFSPKP